MTAKLAKLWIHSRKGPIIGDLVALRGEWATIRLRGDQDLRYRGGSVLRRLDDGELLTVRASLLHPVPDESDVVA